MASINTIVKRKQYLWLGIVVVGTASAIGGALYLSDVDMSGNGETVAEQEPVPDMTGVVDTTFDDKVRQHATTEMQVTAAQMQKQYHPVIPIGAGNEVTVVFQDGFQLKTVEEMALERTQSRAEEDNPESPVPVPPSAESHLNGFNTDQMLKQLGNLNPQQFMSGSQGGGNDGK